MAFSVKDKKVLVTGGSKGIGAGISEVFLKEGAKVLITGRNEEDATKYIEEMKEKGFDLDFVKADAASEEDTINLYKKANEILGGLDIVILNAGYYPEHRIENMTLENWDTVLNINLKGVFLNTREAMKYLKDGGRIVITSSITGNRVGNPGLAHYSASKGGVNGFIKTAALELSTKGITINGVEPGNIMTPGMRDVLGPEYIENQEKTIPLHELGEPEDIAYTVMFLASEEAKYITGQTIIVDGGQTLPESPFDLN